MTALQQVVDAVTKAAGWKTATPDAAGVFHFQLNDDLQLEMLSPDGHSILLRGDLAPLPPDTDMATATLKHCAQRVAASCKKRRSVLSLTEGRLCLHRLIRHDRGTGGTGLAGIMPDEVKEFLNDLAWWHNQLRGPMGARTVPPSPFSFGGSGFVWPVGR